MVAFTNTKTFHKLSCSINSNKQKHCAFPQDNLIYIIITIRVYRRLNLTTLNGKLMSMPLLIMLKIQLKSRPQEKIIVINCQSHKKDAQHCHFNAIFKQLVVIVIILHCNNGEPRSTTLNFGCYTINQIFITTVLYAGRYAYNIIYRCIQTYSSF